MSLRTLAQPRWLLSTLLIAGAALFTVGVAAERHATDHHTESGTELTSPPATTTTQSVTTAANGDADGGEATTTTTAAVASGDADGGETTHTSTASDADGGEATTHSEAPGGEATGHSETSGEAVLGVNLESNGLVAVAIIISLALAVLTWLYNRRSVLLVTLAFALVFAVFDIAEIAHQVKDSRSGLAVLAAAIALVHLTTAVVAQQRATTDPS